MTLSEIFTNNEIKFLIGTGIQKYSISIYVSEAAMLLNGQRELEPSSYDRTSKYDKKNGQTNEWSFLSP